MFRIAMLLALMPNALGMRIASKAARKTKQPIVYFEGSSAGSETTITRQSATIYKNRAAKYTFTSDHLHKEYVIESTSDASKNVCSEPFFVRKGDGKMCSTGLFTAPEMTCDSMATSDVEAGIAELSGLEPPSDRGVGLEFEFVARELSSEREAKLRKYLEQKYGSWGAAFRMMMPATKIMAVKECFNDTSLGAKGSCSKNSDCALSDYCRSDGICDDRFNCKDASDAKEGMCLMPLARWNWESDGSVHPLSRSEANSIDADIGETQGVAFEVTSPGPPHVLSGTQGFKSAYEMLSLLRHVGIQAGPSQGMHVHVNVMGAKAPGEHLSQSQVAAVWAAYAKYQLVIDEMLSPGRPGNSYAQRLFLGNCQPKSDSGDCNKDPCACTRRIFNQMHQWLRQKRAGTALEFCNAILAMPGSGSPCAQRYPHQRYFQVNLIPLDRFGTIEFRAHSATYDPVRVARWVQFLVSLVEYYGRGEGFRKMQAFFAASSSDDDYSALQKAQKEATAAELFKDLKGLVHDGTAEYFGSRVWENGDATCHPKNFQPTTEHSDCALEEDDDDDDDDLSDDGDDSDNGIPGWPWFPGRGGGRGGRWPFMRASLVAQNGTERTMRVPVPRGAEPGSYVDITLPEGNVRAELLSESSIRKGFHEFRHDPDAEAQIRSSLLSM